MSEKDKGGQTILDQFYQPSQSQFAEYLKKKEKLVKAQENMKLTLEAQEQQRLKQEQEIL